MKISMSGLAAFVVLALSSFGSNDAHAVAMQNRLFRCTIAGNPTVCYSAFTNASTATEGCAMVWLQTKGEAVFGGGLSFAPIPNADIWKIPTLPTCALAPASTAYSGHISPCAPGGPDGWKHMSGHKVKWLPLYPAYEINSPGFSQLPLPVRTCPDGGGGGW